MDQETTAESSAAFEPRPLFGDTARPEPIETTRPEPAGRQEPSATAERAGETGEGTTAPPEAKDGPNRDAAGRFAPKAEAAPDATGSPPAAHPHEPPTVPVAVHVAERKKLQERIAALEAQVARPQPQQVQPQGQPQQPRPQPIQPPSAELMFSDPDRYHAGMIQYQHALATAQQAAFEQRQFAQSEAFARRQWSDFDDALAALEQERTADPVFRQSLAMELRQSPDPAGHAYQRGKELLSRQRWQPIMQQHGDPDAFINAEVERRLAERGQQPAASSQPVTLPPASLASARSVGQRGNASTWTGPRPLFQSGRRA